MRNERMLPGGDAGGDPRSFFDWMESNPCEGCPAPCCRLQLHPVATPTTVTELDFLRYNLMFPGTEIVVGRDGVWMQLRWQACAALDGETCRCAFHGTTAKPLVCVHFSPYNCWYKRNFTAEAPPDLFRLDLRRFDAWVEELAFGPDGEVLGGPDFDAAAAFVREVGPVRVLEMGEEVGEDTPSGPRGAQPACTGATPASCDRAAELAGEEV